MCTGTSAFLTAPFRSKACLTRREETSQDSGALHPDGLVAGLFIRVLAGWQPRSREHVPRESAGAVGSDTARFSLTLDRPLDSFNRNDLRGGAWSCRAPTRL